MTTYDIDDKHGNVLTQGLQGYDAARAAAQRIADRLGEPVFLYESAPSTSTEYEQIDVSPPPPRR